jgi:aerobic carbon-monoxide dehydrogenase medium subunit
MPDFELAEPSSVDDALALLDVDDPSVRPIGGGTALMLMMKAQLFSPARLVSLRRLGPPFIGVALSEDGAFCRVGSMTTFAELEHAPVIRTYFPVIKQTMNTLANVRVRNVATVGGNLAHADPHLDLPPVWVALGAEVLIVNRTGERRVAAEDIFAGYYETTLQNGELIAEVCVPHRPTWRSTYRKVTTRAEHDWPALGLAVSAEIVGRYVKDVRIVLSAAVDRPTRLRAAEEVLRGRDVSATLLDGAGQAATQEVEITTDLRGSAAYKRHLLRIHLARAFEALAGA